MTDAIWIKLIRHLPPGLTLDQAAGVFRRSKNLVRRKLVSQGYRIATERKQKLPEWVGRANWALPNVVLAKQFDLSRERVRQFRNLLNMPKVEARGRKRVVRE